jgi:hypothetical protein
VQPWLASFRTLPEVQPAAACRPGTGAGTLAEAPARGVFRTYVMVGGEIVIVQGQVVSGVIGISNFWVERPPV